MLWHKGIGIMNPSLPKSSKYLLRRCFERPSQKGVWGSKHLLTRYLESLGMGCTFFEMRFSGELQTNLG